MLSTLGRELKQLAHGDHVGVFGDDDASWQSAALPYVARALDRGEPTFALLSPHLAATLAACAPADARERLLTITTDRDPLLRRWSFSADALIVQLRDFIARAGARGASLVIDVAWAFGESPRPDQVIGFEARLDRFMRERRATALAWYDRRAMPAPLLAQLLRTHPFVVVDDVLCENVYHDPPQLLIHEHDAEQRLRSKLDRLKKGHGLQSAAAHWKELHAGASPARGAA